METAGGSPLPDIDLSGSHVALVTPLTSSRDVHGEDTERLVLRLVSDGAAGVLVAGSTGEGTLLEPEMRAELTRRARSAVDGTEGSALVLAGACGSTVAGLHRDVERLTEAGADAVLVLAPHTYPLAPEELVDLHLDVAERAEVPTLIYHLPQYTGSTLTPDTLRDVSGHPRIVGIKDSSPDVERKLAFVEVAGEADDFVLLTGHSASLHRTLRAGASGSITAVANVRLRHVIALQTAVASGDHAEAERRQAQLDQLSDGLKKVGPTPAVMKAALQLDGALEERWCRPPLRSVAPNQLDHVRTALLR